MIVNAVHVLGIFIVVYLMECHDWADEQNKQADGGKRDWFESELNQRSEAVVS